MWDVIPGGPAFVIVYVNNESIGNDVWFDDLNISYYSGGVLEQHHYYPFGLTLSSTAAGANEQPYKYQGIELEKHYGLETYETTHRGLDPQIGRFNQIDKLAEHSMYQSPYASMDNNPVSNTDPDGLFSRVGAWWRNAWWGGDGIVKNHKTGQWGVRTSGANWDGSLMLQITYKGNPRAFPSQIKENYVQQMEFKQSMEESGFETKWNNNIGDARKDFLNFHAALMINQAPQLSVANGAAATEAVATKGGTALRAAYVSEVEGLSSVASKMRAAGSSSEEIARTLHGLRRELGVKYKSLTPDNLLQQIYQRNLQKYGDKLGPTIDYLRQQGKSWDDIINSATRTGGKDLGF